MMAKSSDESEQVTLVRSVFALFHFESMNMTVSVVAGSAFYSSRNSVLASNLRTFIEMADNAEVAITFKKKMADPNLVHSGLSQRITVEGHEFSIEIYSLEHEVAWSLEVVDDEGTSTVWDDLFDTDQAALDEVLKAVEKEGRGAFRENADVIPFPKK